MAILLDLQLSDVGGWVVLARLKHDLRTRHIPVHVISATGDQHRSLERGAIGFLAKPARTEQLAAVLTELIEFAGRQVRELLIVDPDEARLAAMVELIGDTDVHSTTVPNAEQALAQLERRSFDCMVLGLPDDNGLGLLAQLVGALQQRRIPVVLHMHRALSEAEEQQFRSLAERVAVRRARSLEQVLDETARFLHRVVDRLPEPKREILRRLSHTDTSLAGRKVMVVDDDVRNIFAITAILEQHEISVAYAENGADALRKLDEQRDVELVLMDIMMPEMDGYEATRRIRASLDLRDLPIIALTAKAMKGDREQCVQAGASDYITKPINSDQLISLLRVWLG
jgi:hypothetical protein